VLVCCKICSKEQSLSNQGTWKRHYLTHASEAEKPYPCTYCAKRFSRSDVLKIHTKNVHEKKLNQQKLEVKQETW